MPKAFHEYGDVDHMIDIEVTYQIIGLFSEGLYSSPYKALEELVSNAFDADASHVHVVLPADLADPSAALVVLDDGVGMDAEGLRTHWIVGDSVKQENRSTGGGRRTIGKFGIGKLAAYVLGDRLTHITRVGTRFFSTTMDFRLIPQTVQARGGKRPPTNPANRIPVKLPLRVLNAAEARSAMSAWMHDGGLTDLKLFGRGAAKSWTVAVISDLKPMAQELTPGKLRWLLGTAMPLRDDFKLYLNDAPVPSAKVRGPKVGSWILGKTLKHLPKPAPAMSPSTNPAVKAPEYSHWHLVDTLLGPISGYLEVFADPIDSGKSEALGRSNGFFVYVNGRLINPYDVGFGIDRNSLRHGTFSRFRLVVNMDRLDAELRSSRSRFATDRNSSARAKSCAADSTLHVLTSRLT